MPRRRVTKAKSESGVKSSPAVNGEDLKEESVNVNGEIEPAMKRRRGRPMKEEPQNEHDVKPDFRRAKTEPAESSTVDEIEKEEKPTRKKKMASRRVKTEEVHSQGSDRVWKSWDL